jgi:hypothetical protein
MGLLPIFNNYLWLGDAKGWTNGRSIQSPLADVEWMVVDGGKRTKNERKALAP